MGLIRAALKSGGSTLADQWIEYFYCDSLTNDVLVKKGMRQETKGGNTKASDNIITNGAGIAVNEGQAILIVEDGKVVDFSVEAGKFTWDTSSEPSLFDSGWKGLKDSFKTFGKRFSQGGETGKDQRIYFVNTKEVFDNKFGSATAMPYRDPTYRGIYIRYFGQYTFKISDPLTFYANVSGNVENEYTKSDLMEQCDAEFISAFDSALSMCSDEGFQYNDLPKKQSSLSSFMNTTLNEQWLKRRGMEVSAVAVEKVTPDDESRQRMEKIDDAIMMSDSRIASGRLVDAQANAMENAASNESGAFTGFLGMGMAANAQPTGSIVNNMTQQQNNPMFGGATTNNTASNVNTTNTNVATSWTCECGHENTSNFCSECGKSKPQSGFTCSNVTCGYTTTQNIKFCPNCGSPKKQ